MCDDGKNKSEAYLSIEVGEPQKDVSGVAAYAQLRVSMMFEY